MSLFDTGIIPAVNAYLKAKSEEERDYGEYWSASSAGYCMRLILLRRMGVPPVPEIADSAARTRVFEAGHIFHEWLQRITKDAGLSVAQEVELQDEDLMVRGHFDDLVLVPDPLPVDQYDISSGEKTKTNAHLILYDYKTAHSAAFGFKKGKPIGHYHKMQLGTYMYMLRKLGENSEKLGMKLLPLGKQLNKLSEGRILTISKDDLRLDECQLIWSDELEQEVVSYWTTLNKYWTTKKLPPCTCLDHDGGFMGRRSKKGKVYNDYFYQGEPCSLEWVTKWKKEQPMT